MSIRMKLRHPTRPSVGQTIICMDGVYEWRGKGWYTKLDSLKPEIDMKSIIPTTLEKFEKGLTDGELHRRIKMFLDGRVGGASFGASREVEPVLQFWIGKKEGKPDVKGRQALETCRRVLKIPQKKAEEVAS